MTRRVIKAPRTMEGKDVYGFSVVKYPRTGVPIEVMALDADGAQINNILPKFKVGEVVAVAQPYKDVIYTGGLPHPLVAKPGWTNKMFVRADLMLHKIRITNVRVERLQDISDDDCLREGVQKEGPYAYYVHGKEDILGLSAKGVFSLLIDRISGKETWMRNPWVFVYEFELVK